MTLVELLVAGAIAGLLMTALSNILSNLLEISRVAREGHSLDRDTQLVLSRLREDVTTSSRVLAVTPASLDLQSIDGSLVSYAMAGGDSLHRRVNAGAWQLVAANVDSLFFTLQTLDRPYTYEAMVPDTVEALMRSFAPGDLDAHIASTDCDYESHGERKVENDDYCMVEFWEQPVGFFAFSRVEIRMKAKDHDPPEVDTWIKIHKSDAFGWPGNVVAQGTLSRLSVPSSYEWVSIALTPTVYETIPDNGDYWLVVGSEGFGGGTYAGHFEYERIKDCDWDEWPANGACFWYTHQHYADYHEGGADREGFHRIYGLRLTPRLTEVTETVTDTLGVAYALTLQQPGEREHRAGFIALYRP